MMIDDRENLAFIFDPKALLHDMLDRDVLEEVTGVYSYDVCTLCHNAATWCVNRLKHYGYPDEILDLFHIVTGSYKVAGPIGSGINVDHSWVELTTPDGVTVIDMTLPQFRRELEGPYIGPMLEEYNEHERVNFANTHALYDFVLNL